ncbi:MAG: hypothetical protein JXX14_12875 [Deltaproteobacteria bacterium]|nr:hypothetical protein [Deltaproteobacteria bacterium]
MSDQTTPTEAKKQYSVAYETHYKQGDLREAFALYRNILSNFPNTREAGYARSQIQHIVNAMVPKEDRLESQIRLASAVFEKN